MESIRTLISGSPALGLGPCASLLNKAQRRTAIGRTQLQGTGRGLGKESSLPRSSFTGAANFSPSTHTLAGRPSSSSACQSLKPRKAAILASKVNPTPAPPEGKYIGKLGKAAEAIRSAPGADQLTSATSHAHRGAPPGNLSPAAIFIPLALAVALPVFGGILVSSYASPLSDWFQDLAKPSWEPPGWLFGAVWSILYALMGMASFVVWAGAPWPAQVGALRLYSLQLIVNYAWNIVFFKMQQLGASVLVLGTLVILVFSTMTAFASINPVAGWLIAPYFLWTVYALALNWSIWRLNDVLPGASWSSSPRQGGW